MSLKPGKYKCKVIESMVAEGKNKNPQVLLKVQITQGESAGSNYTSFLPLSSEKAVNNTMTTLLRIKFLGNEIDDLNKPASLVFKDEELDLTLENETYEGKTRLKMKWIEASSAKKYTGSMKKFSDVLAAKRKELGSTETINPFLDEEMPL